MVGLNAGERRGNAAAENLIVVDAENGNFAGNVDFRRVADAEYAYRHYVPCGKDGDGLWQAFQLQRNCMIISFV